MRKIVAILILAVLNQSCSVFKKVGFIGIPLSPEYSVAEALKGIESQNITKQNFYIQKAEIEIVLKGGRERLVGSVKFNFPDRYLFSLKSRTGIEAARIFLSKDSIFINDRINKKLYFGSTKFLKNKFGFSSAAIPVFFGDYINEKPFDGKQTDLFQEKRIIFSSVSGKEIVYSFDRSNLKPVSVVAEKGFKTNSITLSYSKFRLEGKMLIPGRIEMNDINSDIKIVINIRNFESNWTGSIDFIPGKGYEKKELQ